MFPHGLPPEHRFLSHFYIILSQVVHPFQHFDQSYSSQLPPQNQFHPSDDSQQTIVKEEYDELQPDQPEESDSSYNKIDGEIDDIVDERSSGSSDNDQDGPDEEEDELNQLDFNGDEDSDEDEENDEDYNYLNDNTAKPKRLDPYEYRHDAQFQVSQEEVKFLKSDHPFPKKTRPPKGQTISHPFSSMLTSLPHHHQNLHRFNIFELPSPVLSEQLSFTHIYLIQQQLATTLQLLMRLNSRLLFASSTLNPDIDIHPVICDYATDQLLTESSIPFTSLSLDLSPDPTNQQPLKQEDPSSLSQNGQQPDSSSPTSSTSSVQTPTSAQLHAHQVTVLQSLVLQEQELTRRLAASGELPSAENTEVRQQPDGKEADPVAPNSGDAYELKMLEYLKAVRLMIMQLDLAKKLMYIKRDLLHNYLETEQKHLTQTIHTKYSPTNSSKSEPVLTEQTAIVTSQLPPQMKQTVPPQITYGFPHLFFHRIQPPSLKPSSPQLTYYAQSFVDILPLFVQKRSIFDIPLLYYCKQFVSSLYSFSNLCSRVLDGYRPCLLPHFGLF